MLAKGNMCKGVGRLRRLAIQKQRRTGWISLNREGRDLLDLSECQTNFGNHPPADLEVLLNRLIGLQCGGQLMLAKGNMWKDVVRLGRLAIQKQRRIGWSMFCRERPDCLHGSDSQ